MKLSDLLDSIEILNARGDLSGEVGSLCYDSRCCDKGSLFVAVSGLKADGHGYIGEATARGARIVVYEREGTPLPENIPAVRVRDSRIALGALGRRFYGDPSSRLCLIGVTGTNGKTTVTYLLESILQAAGHAAGVLGTVNYRYQGTIVPAPNTTPESFEMQRMLATMADAGVTHVVAEVSSHAVDLRRVDDCDFDLGIFTNLSQDHLDYHGTMEAYYEAKKRFFAAILPGSKKTRDIRMVVNSDDPAGSRLLQEVDLPAWSFGTGPTCRVRALRYGFTLAGTTADIQAGSDRFTLTSPLIGRFNLYNLLAATAASLSLGLPVESIIRGISDLKTIPGRLELVSRAGEPCVFVDYAHTEDALSKVLENLLPFRKKHIVTVFGCGGDRDRGKRPRMGAAAIMGSDWTILTSDNPRSENPREILAEIEGGIPPGAASKQDPDEPLDQGSGKRYTVIPDRRAAIEAAIRHAGMDDVVLIAGKGHEDYQIIGDKRLWFDDRVVAREALSTFHGGRPPS